MELGPVFDDDHEEPVDDEEPDDDEEEPEDEVPLWDEGEATLDEEEDEKEGDICDDASFFNVASQATPKRLDVVGGAETWFLTLDMPREVFIEHLRRWTPIRRIILLIWWVVSYSLVVARGHRRRGQTEWGQCWKGKR